MDASDSEAEKSTLIGRCDVLNIAPPIQTRLRVRVREFILKNKPKPCLSQQTRLKKQYIVFLFVDKLIRYMACIIST